MTVWSRVGQQSSAHRVAGARAEAGAPRRRHHFFGDDGDEPGEIDRARVHQKSVLEPANLQQPPDVARLAHRRGQPQIDDFLAAAGIHQARPQREHVRAVVLTRVARQRRRRAHRRAHAAHLVRGDRRAQARAIDDDAGVGFLAGHGLRATAPAMSG